MWQKTDKILTKNCQKPKCLQNLSKILLKYGKNVSKFKKVFKICQNQFHKYDKNLANLRVLTVFLSHFCPGYETFWGNIVTKYMTKLWQNLLFWYIFDTFYVCHGNIHETFWSKIVTKICHLSVVRILIHFCHNFVFKGQSLNMKANKGQQWLEKSHKNLTNLTVLTYFWHISVLRQI